MNKTKETILVVDDDQELRTTIAEILEQESLAAVTAENADRALELLEQSSFSLVLLDMVMPGTDGMTAITLIKKLSPKTRIVVITAYSSIQSAIQAMQLGADDYLTKPFKIEALLTAVRKNLAEAGFSGYPERVDFDSIFQGLSNLLRRRIILVLQKEGPYRFMDLVRTLGVEDHTKVSFHLKVLKEAGFIEQNPARQYVLTAVGARAADCLELFSRGL